MQAEPGGREATILGLSHDIFKGLNELRGTLNTRFNRTPEVTEKDSAERPEQPNVVDEIIDNLQSATTNLHADTIFISNEVLPKIN